MDLNSYVSFQYNEKYFPIFNNRSPASIYFSSKDIPGVIRSINDLKADIEKVTGIKPKLVKDKIPIEKNIIIAGTIGKNPLLDQLIKNNFLNVSKVSGKWETFVIQTIEKPFNGVEHALIIAGSDKRGTIFGIYDLAEKMGISPWYWWADVPVDRKSFIFIKPGIYIQSPSVKYRGIFLNDEYPDLTNWIIEKFGNIKPQLNPPIPEGVASYNREFYKKLFELILRLKGNYLWPAMWNNAFNEDDQENPKLAHEYGIVMGTSHQEPMLRSQKEWDRRYKDTLGYWNYASMTDVLENFWKDGIRRNKNYESIITIGLRGADDTPMAQGGYKRKYIITGKNNKDTKKNNNRRN